MQHIITKKKRIDELQAVLVKLQLQILNFTSLINEIENGNLDFELYDSNNNLLYTMQENLKRKESLLKKLLEEAINM